MDGVCVQCRRVLRRFYPQTPTQVDELRSGLRLVGLYPYHYETDKPLIDVSETHAPTCVRAKDAA